MIFNPDMKIFVTGGAGFIGRHLVRTLLKGKNEITIYENFSNSTTNEIKDILKTGVNLVRGDNKFQVIKKKFD